MEDESEAMHYAQCCVVKRRQDRFILRYVSTGNRKLYNYKQLIKYYNLLQNWQQLCFFVLLPFLGE